MDGLQAGGNFFERATEPNRHGNLMTAHIAKRALATASFGQAPRVGHVHVAHEIFGIDTVEVHDIANHALVDDLLDGEQGRGLDVVVTQNRLQAARLSVIRRRSHALGIGNRGRHRLLTPYVLAVRQGHFRGFEVGEVWGANGDHIDIIRAANLSPVIRGALKLIA